MCEDRLIELGADLLGGSSATYTIRSGKIGSSHISSSHAVNVGEYIICDEFPNLLLRIEAIYMRRSKSCVGFWMHASDVTDDTKYSIYSTKALYPEWLMGTSFAVTQSGETINGTSYAFKMGDAIRIRKNSFNSDVIEHRPDNKYCDRKDLKIFFTFFDAFEDCVMAIIYDDLDQYQCECDLRFVFLYREGLTFEDDRPSYENQWVNWNGYVANHVLNVNSNSIRNRPLRAPSAPHSTTRVTTTAPHTTTRVTTTASIPSRPSTTPTSNPPAISRLMTPSPPRSVESILGRKPNEAPNEYKSDTSENDSSQTRCLVSDDSSTVIFDDSFLSSDQPQDGTSDSNNNNNNNNINNRNNTIPQCDGIFDSDSDSEYDISTISDVGALWSIWNGSIDGGSVIRVKDIKFLEEAGIQTLSRAHTDYTIETVDELNSSHQVKVDDIVKIKIDSNDELCRITHICRKFKDSNDVFWICVTNTQSSIKYDTLFIKSDECVFEGVMEGLIDDILIDDIKGAFVVTDMDYASITFETPNEDDPNDVNGYNKLNNVLWNFQRIPEAGYNIDSPHMPTATCQIQENSTVKVSKFGDAIFSIKKMTSKHFNSSFFWLFLEGIHGFNGKSTFIRNDYTHLFTYTDVFVENLDTNGDTVDDVGSQLKIGDPVTIRHNGANDDKTPRPSYGAAWCNNLSVINTLKRNVVVVGTPDHSLIHLSHPAYVYVSAEVNVNDNIRRVIVWSSQNDDNKNNDNIVESDNDNDIDESDNDNDNDMKIKDNDDNIDESDNDNDMKNKDNDNDIAMAASSVLSRKNKNNNDYVEGHLDGLRADGYCPKYDASIVLSRKNKEYKKWKHARASEQIKYNKLLIDTLIEFYNRNDHTLMLACDLAINGTTLNIDGTSINLLKLMQTVYHFGDRDVIFDQSDWRKVASKFVTGKEGMSNSNDFVKKIKIFYLKYLSKYVWSMENGVHCDNFKPLINGMYSDTKPVDWSRSNGLFVAYLNAFYQSHETLLKLQYEIMNVWSKLEVEGHPLYLNQLFFVILNHGGLNYIRNFSLWELVYSDMSIPKGVGMQFIYSKFLTDFEDDIVYKFNNSLKLNDSGIKINV